MVSDGENMFMFQAGKKKSSKSYLVNVALKTSARWSSRWSQSRLLSKDTGTDHLGSMNVCTRFHGDFEIFWSGPNWWGHPTESRTGLRAQPECMTGILRFSPMLHSQPSHYADCFLISFQPNLNCPHMALWLKAPPIPLFGSSSVCLHAAAAATAAVFGSSPQIKNSLLGRWESIWKIACGRMKHVTTLSHTGWGQRWLVAINHPFSPGGVNGSPENDTAEIRNPFQQFLNGDDLSWNKTPLSEENGRHCGSKGQCVCQALSSSPTESTPVQTHKDERD